MADASDYHLYFKRRFAFGSEEVRYHESEVVHDKIKGTGSTQPHIFIDVGYDSLEGSIGGKDKEEEYAQLDGLSSGIAEHCYLCCFYY